MKTLFKFLIFGAAAFVFCPFSGHANTSPYNISQLLTQNIWTSMESWTDDDGDGVFTFNTPECQADNNWHFNPDGTVVISEDIEQCEPDLSFLETLSATWHLEDNDSLLSLSFSDEGEKLYFEIVGIGVTEITLHLLNNNDMNAPPKEKIILRR